MASPIAQAAGHRNMIVEVHEDRVELKSGWQDSNFESINIRDISSASTSGLVNCTLTLETNKGRVHRVERMSRPEANEIKRAIETQKGKAGLHE